MRPLNNYQRDTLEFYYNADRDKFPWDMLLTIFNYFTMEYTCKHKLYTILCKGNELYNFMLVALQHSVPWINASDFPTNELTQPKIAASLTNTNYGMLYRYVWISPHGWSVLQRGCEMFESIDLCLIAGQRYVNQYSLFPHSDNFAFLSVESFCPCNINPVETIPFCSCEQGNRLMMYTTPFSKGGEGRDVHFEYRTLSGKQRLTVDGMTIERSDNVHDYDKFEFCAVNDQVLFYVSQNPELYDAFVYYSSTYL